MDGHLKRLADVSMDVSTAEGAIAESAYTTAREALDRASETLDAVRADWPSMSTAERAVVGQTARPLRQRMDAARTQIPRLVALTEVPEQERALHLVEDPPDDGELPEPPSAA